MNTISLTIMSTYKTVEVGLFQHKNIIEKTIINNKNASKELIVTIAQLLATHEKKLSDLSYIAVNQGPGPFTTLRTIIASINGLAFACQIPLIGIDAISALLTEYHTGETLYTTALLNAFSGEVYYGIQKNKERDSGYKNAQLFLEDLAKDTGQNSIKFVGAGVLLHEQEIKKIFGSRAIIPDPLPEHCSLEICADLAHKRWIHKENISNELYPLYLKIHASLAHLR